jgi:hypothetical protein
MSIHKLDDGTCVIGAGGMWLPCCYENERAARFAFRLTDKQKAELRDISIAENNGVITWDHIKEFRSKSNDTITKRV